MKQSIFMRLAALLLLLSLLPLCVFAEPKALPDLSHATAACLYNVESDQTLFTYGEEERLYPASTAKLMTALLALEHFDGRLDTVIEVKKEHLKGVGGNNIGLVAGEKLTAEQLIAALLVANANDAAAVLALQMAESLGAFGLLMTQRMKDLGGEDTVFTNPSGVHENGMVTTIGDLLLLAKAAYKNNHLMETAGLSFYTLPATNKSGERTLHNKNALLSAYYLRGYRDRSVTGMNAGATNEAGYCTVASGRSDTTGLTYIAIVMGAESDDEAVWSYRCATELLHYAYDSYAYRTVLNASDIICEIGVELSDKVDHTVLTPAHKVEAFLPLDLDIATELTFTHTLKKATLTAPVSSGQVAGELTVSHGDRQIAVVDLVTKTAIERSRAQELKSQALTVITSSIFTYSVLGLILFAILFVLINAIIRYRRKKALAVKIRRDQK